MVNSQVSRETPLGTASYQTSPGEQHSASQWKSSYQAQCQFEQSGRPHKSQKKIVAPPYEEKSGRLSRASDEESKTGLSESNYLNSVGLKKNSLLSGLGERLVSDGKNTSTRAYTPNDSPGLR